MKIEKWNEERDGMLTELSMRRKLKELGYETTRYVYSPGTNFSPHTHGVDKIDAVLAGRFRLTMNGESVVLEAGDAIYVPRGVEHSAEVIGDDPVISLDAIRRM